MKKHLIAAAVAAAVAVPAMAQNVSVYGTLEVGLEKNKSTAGVNTSSVESHEFVSNRLGFRGEEDLGGGLKAFFRLESGLNTSDGTAGSSGGATNTLFDRGAEIGFSGAFGRVSVGKMDHNGIENNEISLHGNRGLASSTVELDSRASDLNDTISYTTPSFSGLTLNLMVTPKDNGAAGVAGANAAGVNVASVHDGVTSAQIAGTVGGVGVKLGTGTYKETGAVGFGAAGTKTKVTGLSVQYDFKVVNTSVLYQRQDNPGATVDRKYTAFTAAVPLGSGITALLTYATLNYDNSVNDDTKSMIASLKKDLSKRTALYGMYRSTNPGNPAQVTATTLGAYLSTSF